MAQRDERFYLAQMLAALDRALEYTADGKEAFFADSKTQDAVVRTLEILGEAVKGVSDATRQSHPEIPWGQIAETRDRVIRGYFNADLDVIWEIVQSELPVLRERIVRVGPKGSTRTW